MIFTLCYAYATIMQWWRLRTLRNKLNHTLNEQNALLVCSGSTVHDSRKQRSLENLLFKTESRIACTVVPKQKLNLSQWIAFPKNLRYFPIYIDGNKLLNSEGRIFILLQAVLESYTKHEGAIIQVENVGELIGWKATDSFEVILKTDLNNLTKLVNQFSQTDIDINHELKLLKVETVDVEGNATVIKYEKKYLKGQTLKYSYAPVHWNKFVTEVKDLYSKIRDITNPKIKIENGSTKCFEAAATAKTTKKEQKKSEDKKNLEVKKETKKTVEDKDKNTLDVSIGGDHRRHKHSEHNKTQTKSDKKSKEGGSKTKADKSESSSKTKHKTKNLEEKSEAPKVQPKREHRRSVNKLVKQSSVKDGEVEAKVDRVMESSVVEANSSDCSGAKPPNVLVYADSSLTKDNVKRVLFSILSKERYTIYDLPTAAKYPSWARSTRLAVVCGAVPPDLAAHLVRYLLGGGRLLCVCSDLMYSVLHTFTTAEVREHELVRFTYGSWRNVEMMHHIFCYQASPAKKQFSKDSDQSNHSGNEGSSPLAPRTPSNVELRHGDRDYDIQVQVLGTEETWQTPSLLLAKVKSSQGRAVFSQVHLEIDPDEYENDEEKYKSLLSSNEARLEILKDILEHHLDMECDETFGSADYSPGYFLGRYDAKMNMISDCESISQNQLTCDKITVIFCGHNVDPGVATNVRLPVMIHSCPSNFSTLEYFEALSTSHVGRLVLYADLLASSQHLLGARLRHGLAVIPRRQSGGLGRSGNAWLSPEGCAAFSLQLHVPLDSRLGAALGLVQHLAAVAVVGAVKAQAPGLGLGIKWPNDLYADGRVKVGGVVVTTTVAADLAVVNVGCGVNLSNQNPTTCINDLIENFNKENNTNIKPIPYEKYFAIVFNELERLYVDVQKNGVNGLYDLYYQYWLHNDAEVSIETDKNELKKAKVVGIDEFGYLKVQLSDGTTTSVQPDGNSFDMMSGLIAPKRF